MTAVNSDLDFWFFAHSRMLLGVGLPLIFLPSMTASYDGVPSDKTDQASALLNAARNTGGSLGAALIANVLAASRPVPPEPAGRACDPVEPAVPGDAAAGDALSSLSHGSSLAQAQQQAIGWIGQQLQAQTSLLAYVDAFWVLTLLALAAIPLALTLRKVKLGGAPVGMH